MLTDKDGRERPNKSTGERQQTTETQIYKKDTETETVEMKGQLADGPMTKETTRILEVTNGVKVRMTPKIPETEDKLEDGMIMREIPIMDVKETT